MAKRDEILAYIAQEFEIPGFPDSSVNGLQVEGKAEITRVAVAVDAAFAVAEDAIKQKAELLIVHHGLFWAGSIPVTGSHQRLLSLMLGAELNLVAIHLPLDAHATLGNNFGLAKFLELAEVKPAAPYNGRNIGCIGRNVRKQKFSEICDTLALLPGASTPVFNLAFGPSIPERICVVSGAAVDTMYRFKDDGFDTLITGEPRQNAYHFAKENKLNIICAGHYATETIGVRALGAELEKRFKVESVFVDHPTGI